MDKAMTDLWNDLLTVLERHYDGAGHHDLLSRICEDERWFDAPHQRAAAETMVTAMKQAGLAEARIVPFPADGRTRFQDWTTKMAWECRSARLVMDGEVLADRSIVPWTSVMGCGPLAAGQYAVIDIDTLTTIDRASIAGRLVFGAAPPLAIKRRIRDMGAVGVISDFIGNTFGADEQTTKWANAWSDGPSNWYVGADEVQLAGFCISPAAGKRLRERLRVKPDLTLEAHCDARNYVGESQCVTAVIPGRDPAREIWLFGHACEPGANDNTSGVATLIEVARLLRAAIDAKHLPQPLFSIRIIATEECLGMLAFATRNPDLAARAVAGLNVDTVGDRTDAKRPHGLYFGPYSNPSPIWAIGGALSKHVIALGKGEWHFKYKHQVPSADDMIGDPYINIANAWVGRGSDGFGYHSSADTPAKCEALPLRLNALLVAGIAYLTADLNRVWNDAFVAELHTWIDSHMLPAKTDDGKALRRWSAARLFAAAARFDVPATAVASAAAVYGDLHAPPLPNLPSAGSVYQRTTWGSANFIDIPAEKRRFECWSSTTNGIRYWTDGVRPTSAIDRLVAAELDAPQTVRADDVLTDCVAAGIAKRIR